MLHKLLLATLIPASLGLENFLPHDYFGSAKAYSDLVSLNPPVVAQTGAIWAKTSNALSEWTFEIKYRVNGPEHGGKGMAIWHTADRGKGGPIYGSVDNWDGLGLFLAAQPDGSGALRGHLNDRSTQYGKLESAGGNPFSLNRDFAKTDAEKNAFGSCSFKYRNVGTISSIKVSYNPTSLKVTHNDQLCFENFDVALPTGHYFGVSSQSAELPDSHELFQMQVTAQSHISGMKQAVPERGSVKSSANAIHDSPAALDSAMQKIITKLISDSDKMTNRIEELTQMKATIDRIESQLQQISLGSGGQQQQQQQQQNGQPGVQLSGALKSMYEDLLRQIKGMEDKFLQMERHIEKQTEHVVASLPPVAKPLWTAVYFLIFVQLVICGAYIWYRRRVEEKSKFL